MLYLCIVGWNLETILSFTNQHPRICVIAKFCEKNKNAYAFEQKCLIWVFLTKIATFGYFWATILKEVFPCLKSAPSNLSICKISRKNKNAQIFRPK